MTVSVSDHSWRVCTASVFTNLRGEMWVSSLPRSSCSTTLVYSQEAQTPSQPWHVSPSPPGCWRFWRWSRQTGVMRSVRVRVPAGRRRLGFLLQRRKIILDSRGGAERATRQDFNLQERILLLWCSLAIFYSTLGCQIWRQLVFITVFLFFFFLIDWLDITKHDIICVCMWRQIN